VPGEHGEAGAGDAPRRWTRITAGATSPAAARVTTPGAARRRLAWISGHGGTRVRRFARAGRRGLVLAAEVAVALALAALNVQVAAGGLAAAAGQVAGRVWPLWQVGLVRFVALNALAAALALGLVRLPRSWRAWGATLALGAAALWLNATIAAFGLEAAVEQAGAWWRAFAAGPAGSLAALAAVWLLVQAVLDHRRQVASAAGHSAAMAAHAAMPLPGWAVREGATFAHAIQARRDAIRAWTLVALAFAFNVAIAVWGASALPAGLASLVARSRVLQLALALAVAAGAGVYTIDRRDRRAIPLPAKLAAFAREQARPFLRRHRVPLAVLAGAWLLLTTWAAGPLTAVTGVPPHQNIFGTQVFLLYVVALVIYRWQSRVTVAVALCALVLCPFAQLAISTPAAEDLATFAYLMLCLGVGQAMWELKRAPREAQPSDE
jgi:hypothetical protein